MLEVLGNVFSSLITKNILNYARNPEKCSNLVSKTHIASRQQKTSSPARRKRSTQSASPTALTSSGASASWWTGPRTSGRILDMAFDRVIK